MEVPFRAFVLRLEGGFELAVGHPENIVFEPGIAFVTVYDIDGYADTFDTDRIVSVRTAGPP
jgi:hypothetical protein